MSWLNLNESLSSIKGQISSFASGVLAEGIVEDTDPFTELSVANKRVQELQNVVSSQDVEIASLRRQNAELFEKIKFGEKSKNDGLQTSAANSNGEHCFWDPPASEENHVFGGDPSLPQRKNSTNSTVSDLTIRIENLEAEKRDLIQSLEQLDQDCQRTTDKLVTLKDNLQTDFNKLKNDFDFLKLENDALTKDNSKYRQELKKLADENISLKTVNNKPQNIKSNQQEKLEELELKYNAILQEKQTLETNNNNLNKLQTDYDILKSELDAISSKNAVLNDIEAKYQSAENTIKKLTSEITLKQSLHQNSNVSDDFKKIQDQYQDLKTQFDQLQIDSQKMHKKYVNILTETFKKYVDYAIPDEFVLQQNETPEISEFNSKVEAVLKLLLDCKWKTETLERKLCEISHEKAVAVTEKNHEIEKLLHNSEILSQEVITKTQTINHYEMECSELIKNNDLLIQELQQYKTNNGLQTIQESNEDNLLLLESQLEGANKRIKDLELIISDMENAKQDIALETQTELDYIKKQLNMTGKELSQSKKEYQDLLKAYKQFEMDNQNLNIELQKITTAYSTTLTEKQNLESLVERMKNDIENTEYKFVEANVEVDTMKEELQHAKMECANFSNSISSSKKEMEDQIDIVSKERDELKSNFEQYRNEVELNTRNLTEKLQNSKMSETVLKLQNDQIKKELETVSELKSNFDQKMQKYHQDFFEIINAFKDLKHSSYLLHETPIDDDNLTLLDKFVVLKKHFKLLEEKLAMSKNGDDCMEKKLGELEAEKMELLTVNQMLQNNFADVHSQIEILLKNQMELQNSIKNLQEENLELQNKLQGEGGLESVQNHLESLKNKILTLETDVHNLTAEKVELLNVVRSKHEENVQYHSEIQRLNIILSQETDKLKHLEDLQQNIPKVDENVHVMEEKLAEIEKLSDQNSFLKEKCEKLAQNLMEEQSNVQKVLNDRNTASERELNLTKELERLRMHLVEIEDSYTQELLQAEQRSQEMMGKMNEIEQRERDSSTIYTSVSIRANQQVETLQNQLQLVTVQRDELQKKISEAEDKSNKQIAALTNLQCVLEQFQRDREKDIFQETERIRRQISVERQKQTELQEEINLLKLQLDESKQGLKAAARLTDQMEKSNSQVLEMKEEVSKLQDHLRNSENKYKILSNKTNATVDRSLIKNLVVGFIASNNNLTKDQQQILKIIATVLDFTPQDNDKLTSNKPAGGSWMSAILHPQVASNSSMSQQSLSEAFVRFLETESQPKPTPPLLNVRKMSTESNVSSSSSTKQTPILLNEVVLPTFADFAQNRNASSILKDVLKDN